MDDRDITLAFAHPEDRARATASRPFADRLILRDHVVEAEIGAFHPERGRQQRLSFDVVVEVAAAEAGADDVDQVLSYDRITEAIAAEIARERLNLLETLAERIAARVLASPQALRAFVRIAKLDLGPGAKGVEIVREADGGEARPEAAPAPTLVLLSNRAIASPRLPAWLEGLRAAGRAAILCVGPPDGPLPQAGAADAQRRIDLLAVNQNAWVLSARDPRLAVIGSRTELAWASARGGFSVWAPAKMVADASRPPAGTALGDLGAWLAGELGAETVVAVDTDLPPGVSGERRALDAETLL